MKIKNLLLLSFTLVSANATGEIIENFDQPGSDVSLSSFSTIFTAGGGTYLRDNLNGIPGTPNIATPLPINTGGDKELRYFEDLNINVAATTGFALTNNVLSNAVIDTYIGINSLVGPASANGGVMLNVSGTSIPTINGYGAFMKVLASDPTQATLSFVRYENGIGNGISYSGFQPFAVDLTNENYHLKFGVQNGSLTASLNRVFGQDGSIIEQAIDLQTFNGIQNTITVNDSVPLSINPDYDPTDPESQLFIPDPDYEIFSSGKVGLSAFARNGSEVYFDNVSVSTVPIPAPVFCFYQALWH